MFSWDVLKLMAGGLGLFALLAILLHVLHLQPGGNSPGLVDLFDF